MADPLELKYTAFAKQGLGTEGPAGTTGYMSARVANLEPDYLELARVGRTYVAAHGVVTNAIASVTDVPTTTAAMCLANADSSGTKYLAVLRAGFYCASGTVGIGAMLLGAVTSTRIATTPTANATGVTIQSTRGTGPACVAFFKDGVTIPSGSTWFPLVGFPDAPGVGIGAGVTPADLKGAYIIPPLFGFGLSVLSPTGTTPKFNFFVEFAQLELDLPS